MRVVCPCTTRQTNFAQMLKLGGQLLSGNELVPWTHLDGRIVQEATQPSNGAQQFGRAGNLAQIRLRVTDFKASGSLVPVYFMDYGSYATVSLGSSKKSGMRRSVRLVVTTTHML
jgi:hypothetical protein